MFCAKTSLSLDKDYNVPQVHLDRRHKGYHQNQNSFYK